MFDKTKKNLEKEFSKICNYIDDCENKQESLKENTNDSKLVKTGVIGMISLIPSFLASMAITFPTIAGLPFSITTAMGIALASSIAIGYVGQSIITSLEKKKMRKFSNANTNAEILEEMMHYEMEIEKAKIQQDLLKKTYKAIETRQEILSDDSNEFYEIDKYANLTHEEIKKRQELLFNEYKERMEQLDILTSQAYLKNKFINRRTKRERIKNIITYTIIMSLPFCFTFGTPLSFEIMRVSTMENFTYICKQIAISCIPALLVAPLSLPYFVKRDKDFTNAFNNLNKSLSKNALSEKPNLEYEKELNNMISTQISKLVELDIELKELGYVIEKTNIKPAIENKNNSKSKEDILFEDYSQLQITEENRKKEEPKLVKKRIPPKNK